MPDTVVSVKPFGAIPISRNKGLTLGYWIDIIIWVENSHRGQKQMPKHPLSEMFHVRTLPQGSFLMSPLKNSFSYRIIIVWLCPAVAHSIMSHQTETSLGLVKITLIQTMTFLYDP